jgi:ATP-binding cassette subfamily F protein uup
VLNLVAGTLAPTAGRVKRGRTVALEHLTQDVTPEDPEARALATVEATRRVTRTATGQDVSASALLERFGFTGDRLTARIGDLSGGERRRFQLLRLLLSEPNVLLLDEPTNDLDIETLTVLEDFLDGWPGTLVVVSHDRYFLERVTDSVWALLGDGTIGLLPGGVDQYLEMRRSQPAEPAPAAEQAPEPADRSAKAGSAEERAARKALARIDRQLERIAVQEAALNGEIAAAASDYAALATLSEQLRVLTEEREALEVEWLEAASILE